MSTSAASQSSYRAPLDAEPTACYLSGIIGPARLTLDQSTRMSASLPIECERPFSLHLYWVSHGPLLLRSGKSEKAYFEDSPLLPHFDFRAFVAPLWKKT